MLYLPDKKTRKALARARRRRWRRRVARLLLFLFLLFGFTAASAPSAHDLLTQVDALTHPRQFDFVDWISTAFANEVGRRFDPPALPATYQEQRALVDAFLAQEKEIRRLEQAIDQIYAASANPASDAAELTETLARLKAEQRLITPQVETIFSQQVEAVLEAEGLAFQGQAFPPVAFRFVDLPTALILSPRDEIKREYFVGLQPGLDNHLRTEIEDTLHRRGDISSYVANVGGLGSYPSMVITDPNLPYLFDVIAHEWTHNYLYTFPTNIAWGYSIYPQLTTINETVASLVGAEISRKVIERFYPDLIDQLPPLDERGQALPPPSSEFYTTMRRIRQKVDRLLAEGQIDAAEAYMEAERLKLVEKGYNLRRLNQAYFAFHGAYALSPGSIDPTGPQLRQLRAASPSLKDFLEKVGWLNGSEDYLAWLNEAGLEFNPPQ
jgi:hypothetical protein